MIMTWQSTPHDNDEEKLLYYMAKSCITYLNDDVARRMNDNVVAKHSNVTTMTWQNHVARVVTITW